MTTNVSETGRRFSGGLGVHRGALASENMLEYVATLEPDPPLESTSYTGFGGAQTCLE